MCIGVRQTAKIIAPAVKHEIQIEPDLEEWRNIGEGAFNHNEIIQQCLTLPPDNAPSSHPDRGWRPGHNSAYEYEHT
jgi:hypothetical protein